MQAALAAIRAANCIQAVVSFSCRVVSIERLHKGSVNDMPLTGTLPFDLTPHTAVVRNAAEFVRNAACSRLATFAAGSDYLW